MSSDTQDGSPSKEVTPETVLQRVSEAVYAVDTDWQFTYLNEKATAVLDRPREELLGHSLWEAFPEAADTAAREKFKQALETGEPQRFDMHYDPMDAWFTVRAYPDADGLTVCFYDVTEQRGRQLELQRKQRLFEAVFEDADEALVIADTDRRITEFNPRAERLFGYDTAQVLGKTTQFLYNSDDEYTRQGNRRYNADAPESTESYTVTYERADGTTFEGETVGTPLKGPNGETLAYFTAIRDVSARVAHEHAIEKRNEAFREFHDITTDTDRAFDERVSAVVELGRDHLGLDVGVFAAIEGDSCTVEAAATADGGPEAGETFALGDTASAAVVDRGRVASSNEDDTPRVESNCTAGRETVESYLGAPVGVNGEQYGTLTFSQSTESREPFTNSEETLVQLLAQWIGKELAQRRSEERARTNRDRLRQIIDILPQLVFAKDENGAFLLANEAVAEAYGTTVADLEGATDADFAGSQEEADQFRADDRAVIESGEAKHIPEEPLTTAAGDRRILETKKIPYDPVDTDGHAVLGVSTDITELKEKQEELEVRSAAMEASMDGIAILNEDDEYIYMNEAHADIFGYNSDDLLGRTWRDIYGDNEIERLEQEVFPALAADGSWRGETIGKRKDGSEVYQEITLSVLDGGKLICTNRDITEQKERQRERERTRELLEKTQQNASIGWWEVDLDEERLSWSDETYHIHDLTPDQEITLEDALGSYHPDDTPMLRKAFEKLTTEGESYDLEIRLVTAADRVRWVRVVGDPRYGDTGELTGVLGIVQDITERKEREQNLKRTRELVEQTQESASIGWWEIDLVEEKLQWSDEVYRIHDLPLGQEVHIEEGIEFYHPDDRPTIQQAFEKLTTEGESYDLELRIVTAADRVRWVRTVGDPQYNDDREIVGVLGIFQDITERKEREQQVQELKNRLNLAVEGANLGVWDWNMETDGVTFNDQWATMLGLDPAAVEPTIGTWEERVHPEDMDRVEAQLEAHIAGETDQYDCEHRMQTASGDWKWIRDVGEVVERDEDGTPTRAVGIHIDITEQKETETYLEEERDMFAQGPAVVFKWENDEGWPVEYVSENVTETLGYTPVELQSGEIPYERLVHDEDIERVTAEVAENSNETTERFSHDPYRMVTVEGDVRWVKDNTKIIRNDGEITHYLGYLVDITERKRQEKELRRVQERFERFAGAVSDAFFLVSPDYEETYYVNDAVEDLYGVTMGDVTPDPTEWTEHIHPEDMERLREDMQQQRDRIAEWPIEQEFRVQHPERGLRWVQVRIYPVRDAGGDISELAGVATDVTERRELEESLRESEQCLRDLTAIASDTDREFEEKLTAILELGCDRLDLPYAFLTHIEDGTQHIVEARGDHGLLQAGESAPISKAYCRKTIEEDGLLAVENAPEEGWTDDPAYETFELGCYLGGKVNVDGELHGTLCFAGDAGREDIFDPAEEAFVDLLVQWLSYELTTDSFQGKLTGLTRAAQQLMIAESKQDVAEVATESAASILELPITGIWRYDEEANALVPQAATEAADALLGEQPTFLPGQSLAWDVFETGEPAVKNDLSDADTLHNSETRLSSEIILPIGEFGVITTSSTEPRAFSETDVSLLEVLSATVEASFNRAARERALRKTRRELKQSNEQLEQFAYAASHDLQEPLRTVSSYLTLLERRYQDQLDDDAREFIDFAVEGAERMQEMIQALLAFSRVDTQGNTFEPVDLATTFQQVCQNLDVRIEETKTAVTLPETTCTVQGDQRQLVQLFQNLVENGITYSNGDPHIDISVECREHTVAVTVTDDGIGIAADQQEQIFEVFQRLHTPEEYEGTGIGLAICRKVVERHGGEITVDSTPGEGSTFTVTFPATEVVDE